LMPAIVSGASMFINYWLSGYELTQNSQLVDGGVGGGYELTQIERLVDGGVLHSCYTRNRWLVDGGVGGQKLPPDRHRT
jgi:hypothetical protein